MSDPVISRRDFLKLGRIFLLTLCGALGLGMLVRYLDTLTQPSRPTEFDLGKAEDYTPLSRTLLPNVPALLIRNEQGFTALSLVCTHIGCTVEKTAEGFSCPCHGSRYDLQGKVVRGPASESLAILRLETTLEGRLILFTE